MPTIAPHIFRYSNRDKEGLLVDHPSSSTNDDPPSSINQNDDNYSTFTPKANDDDETTNVVAEEEEDQETTCCCCCSDKPCCCNKKCCSNLWKEHRFTIILALILLASLAVPLYFLVRHAHFEFDYHKECVTCFNDKADFEVIFNQTNGTCELYVQNETYNSNNIVLDPNFCGAPHCQNLELLPGLRLAPYWAVAISAVFSIVLSVGVNLVKYYCYFPIKRRFVKWKWDEEVVEQNPIIRLADEYGEVICEAAEKDQWNGVRSELETLRKLSLFLKTFGLTDPFFFILLLLFAVGHFIFCIYEVVTKPTFAHRDGWHKYQTIYGLFLNSGSIEVVLFTFTMGPLGDVMKTFSLLFLEEYLKKKNTSLVPRWLANADENRRNMAKNLVAPLLQFGCVQFLIWFPILFVAPILYTHIFPGVVFFTPYLGGVGLTLGIVFAVTLFFMSDSSCTGFFRTLAEGVFSRDSQASFGERVSDLVNRPQTSTFLLLVALLRLLGTFLVLLFVPILFNWTVLFYQGRTWSDVMTGEYRLRNTDCYFNAIVNNIQIYNVGFVGLIFS